MKLAAALILVLVACGDDSGGAAHDAAVDARADGPSADGPDQGVIPRVEPTACRYDVPSALGVEGQAYACGDLVVYENRIAKSRTIKVHYIKFASTAGSANATIYLDGGPGGDGQNIISYATFLGAPFFDGLRADGDFLVISQRGTSRSLPFLRCEESACADFAGTYDLASYNTAENADDVEDLRAALGYAKLNLYGISYGSRLGLEVLRRHGASVRAAVIEGLVPSSVIWPAAVPSSFYSALTALDASCTAAGACGTAYGNLVGKFSSGVETLNANPVTVMVQGMPFPLDGYTYASVLFRVMYAKSSYTWLPLLISDLAVRRVDRVQTFLANVLGQLGGGSDVSMGLYNSVVCGELFNPPDPTASATLNAGVPADIREMFDSFPGLAAVCATWPKGNLQAALAAPVTSAVRTLVSSGRLDPITPPGFANIAATTLSNAVVVVHENSGHGATLQSACGVQNLVAFIANPDAPQDTSCAASITTSYMLPSTFAAAPMASARLRVELGMAPPLPPAQHERLRRALRPVQ